MSNAEASANQGNILDVSQSYLISRLVAFKRLCDSRPSIAEYKKNIKLVEEILESLDEVQGIYEELEREIKHGL